MRIDAISYAVLAFVLAGCSGSQPSRDSGLPSTSVVYTQPRPTNEQIQTQAKQWAECSVGKIVELDDGRSDAGVVATAVTAACRPYYRGRPNDDYPIVVEAVLKIRANKAKSKPPTVSRPQPMIPSSSPANPPPPMIPAASTSR